MADRIQNMSIPYGNISKVNVQFFVISFKKITYYTGYYIITLIHYIEDQFGSFK